MKRVCKKSFPRVRVNLSLTEEAYKYANEYIENLSAFVSKCICNYGKKCEKEEIKEDKGDDTTNMYYDENIAEIVKMKWVSVDD